MNAIARWQEKVRAAQAVREEQGERTGVGHWDATRAAWFNRFAGRSDRSDTYRFVAPHVKGRVLEIGPGPGAYTRLLLRDAQRVVAVEPAPDMVRLLRENMAQEGLATPETLTIVESTIEEFLPHLESYDLALAANVLSGILRIDEVLGAVAAHSDVLAIVMWANARTPDWSKDVQVALLGQATPRPNMPDHDDLMAVLDELGLRYDVHPVDVPIHTFERPEAVVDWVQGFHAVPAARRAELERILAPHISERGGKFGLLSGRDTRVVLVRRGEL